MTNNEIKAGDLVTWNGLTQYDVLAVTGGYAWVSVVGAERGSDWMGGRLASVDRLTKAEPFFEPGKSYRRHAGSTTDTFAVARVDRSSNGGLVAYGEINKQEADSGNRYLVHHSSFWTTVHSYNGWQAV